MIHNKKWTLLGIALLSCKVLEAQNICQETAVYFDSGKSRLTANAMRRLDSLVALWGNGEVHLELTGHTDSVMQADFNQKLSEDRVSTVRSYLEAHTKAKLDAKTFAKSENDPVANNGSELGKAQNRRVALKYVALKNGKLVIPSSAGASVHIPISSLGSCSACDTRFSVTYFRSDQEIQSAGYSMATTTGGTLTTGGMMTFQSSCFDANKEPIEVCFRYPSTAQDPEMSGWTMNQKGLWEPLKGLSNQNDTVEVCMPASYKLIVCNRDCELRWEYYLRDSSNLHILHRKLFTIGPKKNILLLQPDLFYQRDSLKNATYTSLAEDEKGNLWFCNQELAETQGEEIARTLCHRQQPYIVKKFHYQPILFSDTIQRFKVRRKYQIEQVAYFLKDADTTLAFDRIGKRKFEAPILKYPHTLQFKNEKGKIKALSPKRIALKYKRRKQRMVGKVKKF